MSSTTYSRDETVAAITDFYKFYIRLPYIDRNALVLAPEDGGWPDIDATELRNCGKSDEVIELLRHLPYIEHPSFRGGWTIDLGSDCIQYHKGACYNNSPDLIKSLPGHVIPIADPTDRDGCYLLLDTQSGKITRYNIMANNIEGNWDAYERLDDNDKWRAFPTAPVGQFFGRWKKLYEKLVWMVAPPVDDSHGDGGTYFTRADNAVEENKLLEAGDDDDVEIEDEFTKACSNAEVYEIYKRNGWPESAFDREGHSDQSHPEHQHATYDLLSLIEKVEAGADFLMTQLFYDIYAYQGYEKMIRQHESSELPNP
ncbi:hypothetical protein KCU95_g2928, partial [Aureobasidium melanogenum]